MAKIERRGLFAVRAIGIGLALLLVAWLFQSVNLERVTQLLAGVGLAGALLVAAPQALSSVCECLAWRQAFTLWQEPVALLPLLRVRIASEALAQTLPLGAVWAESLKPALLMRHADVPLVRGIAAGLVRRYLLVISQVPYTLVCALAGGAALRVISLHFLGTPWLVALPWLAALILLALAFGIAGASAKGRVALRLHAALSAIPSGSLRAFLSRSRPQFTRGDDLLERYFAAPFSQSTLKPGFLVFVGWLSEAIESFLILRLLGVHLDFDAVLGIEGCVAFARNVMFVLPAGLGVQELGYSACLAALGVPDALNASAAFSILRRSKELAWAALGYGLLLSDLRERAPDLVKKPA